MKICVIAFYLLLFKVFITQGSALPHAVTQEKSHLGVQKHEEEQVAAEVCALVQRMFLYHENFLEKQRLETEKLVVDRNGIYTAESFESFGHFLIEARNNFERDVQIFSQNELNFNAAMASLFDRKKEISDAAFYFFLDGINVKNIRPNLKKVIIGRVLADTAKFKKARAERTEKDPNNALKAEPIFDPMTSRYMKLGSILGAEGFETFKALLDAESEFDGDGSIAVNIDQLHYGMGASRDPRAYTFLKSRLEGLLNAHTREDVLKRDKIARANDFHYIFAISQMQSPAAQAVLVEIYAKAKEIYFGNKELTDLSWSLRSRCMEGLERTLHPSQATLKFVNTMLRWRGQENSLDVRYATEIMVQFAKIDEKLRAETLALIQGAKEHYSDSNIYDANDVEKAQTYFTRKELDLLNKRTVP